AIHESVDTLLWRFSPGEHALQGWVVLTLKSEDLGDDRFLLTVGQELGQIGPETILMVVPGLFAGCLVAQDQRQALMQVCLGLQTFGNERGLKGDRRKNLRVRVKGDGRAATTRLANFLQSRGGLAAGVAVNRLIHRVVDNLPYQMVQPSAVHAADVHAWALAHRLQAFEDGDVLGRVAVVAINAVLTPCHSSLLPPLPLCVRWSGSS